MPPYEFRITSPETPDLQIDVKLPDDFAPMYKLTRQQIVGAVARAAKLRDSANPVRFEIEMLSQDEIKETG